MTDARAILEMEKLFPSDRMSARSVRNVLRSASAQGWVAVRPGAPRIAQDVLGCLVLFTRRGSGIARIYSVVVAPAARGQGLGAALVRTAQDWARHAGLHTLSLEVRADNAAARALYARLGYIEHARLPGYYDDGADGLRLRKSLV